MDQHSAETPMEQQEEPGTPNLDETEDHVGDDVAWADASTDPTAPDSGPTVTDLTGPDHPKRP